MHHIAHRIPCALIHFSCNIYLVGIHRLSQYGFFFVFAWLSLLPPSSPLPFIFCDAMVWDTHIMYAMLCVVLPPPLRSTPEAIVRWMSFCINCHYMFVCRWTRIVCKIVLTTSTSDQNRNKEEEFLVQFFPFFFFSQFMWDRCAFIAQCPPPFPFNMSLTGVLFSSLIFIFLSAFSCSISLFGFVAFCTFIRWHRRIVRFILCAVKAKHYLASKCKSKSKWM